MQLYTSLIFYSEVFDTISLHNSILERIKMNDSIEFKGLCEECKAEEFPRKNDKVGKKVIADIALGRGYSRTEYEYFQCLECGSIWLTMTDSGAGGHGTYRSRLK